MILHRLCEVISRKTRVIILTPSCGAVGNCAEEIYFGLLKARREGKKAWMLFPRELPGKFQFRLANRELFDVDCAYRWGRNNSLLGFLGGLLLTFLYGPPRIVSRITGKLFRRHLPGRYVLPSIGEATLWQPREDMKDFSWDVVDSYHWREQLNEPLAVRLHPEKQAEAERLRLDMGLPKDAWFACLHVREGGFYNDHAASACRNASIKNYIPGIKTITDRGGWVVRMGDKTMTPLPPLERVIDYPHTRFKSELLDVYLLSECRFYIGLQSGILDLAWLFQKPMVFANMSVWTHAFPLRRGDLGIPKHIYSRSRGHFLSLQEILEEDWGCQYLFGLGEDHEMHENTPEEIREVIVEFLEQPRNSLHSELQQEFNRRRVLQGRRLLSRPVRPDHFSDIFTRYRIASRLASAEGTVGQKFLEENWRQSSRTALARS